MTQSRHQADVLIFGSTGQLGKAFSKLYEGRAIMIDRNKADFSDPPSVVAILNQVPQTISAIINAAAYTQVDHAEKEEMLVHTINCEVPATLAYFAKQRGVPFIHFSTDYVFPGTGHFPYVETHKAAPLSAYGRTKLAGEKVIQEIGGDYLIFRTSWVYDAVGKNFFTTMLRLGADKETLSIVSDQTGAPTYAPHLAEIVKDVLEKTKGSEHFPSGLYHLCHQGETTWYEFAEMIFKLAQYYKIPLALRGLKPISSDEFPCKATRPLNSRLDCSKFLETFGTILPSWEQGLEEAVKRYVATLATAY